MKMALVKLKMLAIRILMRMERESRWATSFELMMRRGLKTQIQ